MWNIIRAEVSYHRYIFLAFLALTPLLIVHEMMGPVERIPPAIGIWLIVFLPVNTWVSVRAKDKRELQYMQMPVEACKIGVARILMVLGSALASTAVYLTLHMIFAQSAPLNINAFFVSTLAVLFIYSLVFIVGDRVVGNRALSDAKIWISILMGFMVLGNIYLLLLSRRLHRSGGEPPAFIRALGYIFEHHPFSSNLHTAVTICVVTALVVLSVVSFTRRKMQFA
jgi:hypothetical protein